MTNFPESYWTDRYRNGETQWDIGYASPALMAYMRDRRKDAKVLIPGAGNAHEAEALHRNGFTNITVLDISPLPLASLQTRVPDFPADGLVCSDFFAFEGEFDIILEQTFFCALPPALRPAYVQKMAALLEPEGELAGVLFDAAMNTDGPPYGGSRDEYLGLFREHLDVLEMEKTALSVPRRAGLEVFFRAKRRGDSPSPAGGPE